MTPVSQPLCNSFEMAVTAFPDSLLRFQLGLESRDWLLLWARWACVTKFSLVKFRAQLNWSLDRN